MVVKLEPNSPGLPPYLILQYLLHQEGWSLEDIDFQELSSQDAGNAFVAQQLDGAGTYEPYLSISKNKRAGAHILISSAETPGLITDLLFASEDLINENSEVLKKISDGWFQAVQYWKTNPEDAMDIMARAFAISVEKLDEMKSGLSWLTLEDNQKLFDQSRADNAYATFTLVGDILERNNEARIRVAAADKLTKSVISLYE